MINFRRLQTELVIDGYRTLKSFQCIRCQDITIAHVSKRDIRPYWVVMYKGKISTYTTSAKGACEFVDENYDDLMIDGGQR